MHLQRSDSVEIVPNDAHGTILLSDDEGDSDAVAGMNEGNDERIMPPPNFIPVIKKEKASLAKTTKSNDEDKRAVRSTRSKQPRAAKVWNFQVFFFFQFNNLR